MGQLHGRKQLCARSNSVPDVESVVFLKTKCVALRKDGTLWFGNAAAAFETLERTEDGVTKFVALEDYIGARKVKKIAATASALALLLDDGELVITGLFLPSKTNFVKMPDFSGDEKITDVAAGTKHFTVKTDKNKIYSFGENYLNQCNAPGKTFSEGDRLISGAFQNYVVSSQNEIVAKWGLKGYLFGTDNFGRDMFRRIMHGGKMTMTIGAVSVIISTVIGILVGCLSGYFGGWVDMLFMRITEVFSSIPFLPFALILSAVLAGSNLTENARILMIMTILGLLSWTGLARMVRGQVLAEREKEFVVAAKAMGVRESKIAFRHILPNIISVILVSITLNFAGIDAHRIVAFLSRFRRSASATYLGKYAGRMQGRAGNRHFVVAMAFPVSVFAAHRACDQHDRRRPARRNRSEVFRRKIRGGIPWLYWK